MSLLNVYIAPPGPGSYALVGVDTESMSLDSGRRFQTSKLMPIVHMNAVLAFRGAAMIQGAIATVIMSGGWTVDEWLAHDGQAFQSVIGGMDRLAELQKSPPMTTEAQEIALVGWSPQRNRFAGRVWKRETYSAGFVPIDVETALILAGDDEVIGRVRVPTNPVAMGELAKVQCRRLRELEPGITAGGRFIVAWLREDHMRIETVCDLP
jgi:hypothetical protein